MTTAPKTTTNDARRVKLIKTIQVGRRELRMDEPTYRAMLAGVGGADSLKDMPLSKMIDVLEHMKKSGFQLRAKTGDRSQAFDSFSRKARALWLFLHALGAVRDPSERALNAYVKRIAKVEDLRWVRHHSQEAVIETLKKWAMRYLPAELVRLQGEVVAHLQSCPVEMSEMDLMHLLFRPRPDCGFDTHWWTWERYTNFLQQPSPSERGLFGEEVKHVSLG
jgi:Mu-like prophage protein gp16